MQIKISENRKVFDGWKKSFCETVLLVPVNRVHGIMRKCTVSRQVTRNGKVGKCDLWTGHHTGNSERIWWQGYFSRTSEAVMPEGVPALLFYQENLGGFFDDDGTQRD